MKWIPMEERKPTVSDFYYWKGKSNYGGREYYDAEVGDFTFDFDVPVNKIAHSYLLWLDESSPATLK